ncbi:hypothetical protein B0H11DRAFT_1908095 [Mycena galericulata]|nr:hypothetical protein B0H11DRAFT_1908095 [Mycena galericulata]
MTRMSKTAEKSGRSGSVVRSHSHRQVETLELAVSKSGHGGSGQEGMDDLSQPDPPTTTAQMCYYLYPIRVLYLHNVITANVSEVATGLPRALPSRGSQTSEVPALTSDVDFDVLNAVESQQDANGPWSPVTRKNSRTHSVRSASPGSGNVDNSVNNIFSGGRGGGRVLRLFGMWSRDGREGRGARWRDGTFGPPSPASRQASGGRGVPSGARRRDGSARLLIFIPIYYEFSVNLVPTLTGIASGGRAEGPHLFYCEFSVKCPPGTVGIVAGSEHDVGKAGAAGGIEGIIESTPTPLKCPF